MKLKSLAIIVLMLVNVNIFGQSDIDKKTFYDVTSNSEKFYIRYTNAHICNGVINATQGYFNIYFDFINYTKDEINLKLKLNNLTFKNYYLKGNTTSFFLSDADKQALVNAVVNNKGKKCHLEIEVDFKDKSGFGNTFKDKLNLYLYSEQLVQVNSVSDESVTLSESAKLVNFDPKVSFKEGFEICEYEFTLENDNYVKLKNYSGDWKIELVGTVGQYAKKYDLDIFLKKTTYGKNTLFTSNLKVNLAASELKSPSIISLVVQGQELLFNFKYNQSWNFKPKIELIEKKKDGTQKVIKTKYASSISDTQVKVHNAEIDEILTSKFYIRITDEINRKVTSPEYSYFTPLSNIKVAYEASTKKAKITWNGSNTVAQGTLKLIRRNTVSKSALPDISTTYPIKNNLIYFDKYETSIAGNDVKIRFTDSFGNVYDSDWVNYFTPPSDFDMRNVHSAAWFTWSEPNSFPGSVSVNWLIPNVYGGVVGKTNIIQGGNKERLKNNVNYYDGIWREYQLSYLDIFGNRYSTSYKKFAEYIPPTNFSVSGFYDDALYISYDENNDWTGTFDFKWVTKSMYYGETVLNDKAISKGKQYVVVSSIKYYNAGNYYYEIQYTSTSGKKFSTGLFELSTSNGRIRQVSGPLDNDLLFFPNPVVDTSTLQGEFNSESYSVYDLNGSQVLNGQVNGVNPQLDFSTLSKGIYLFHVQGKVVKLLKE
ncbi:T9SS type A sorting domain-containing protein [Flammeovirga sp. SJP92]|uniref:T9SS type A sorting domain-containing protein n=1 Tax=Flammeovirga sp. SJP92 TaxID=1775430 RepID=UPI000789177C|nr:T9SS type A sorting domain-containing protein [Flammeovirga sp. SJP92]KXX70970.1 hypothetical protein AVL50_10210 [Flammeovirga sp. SJP92]